MVDGIRNVPFASSCSICCLLFRGKTFPFVAVFTLLVLVSIADAIGAAAFCDICHTLSPFSSCPEPRIETVFRDADASAYPQDTEFGGAVAQVVGRAQAEQGFFKLILFFNPTDLEHQRVKTGHSNQSPTDSLKATTLVYTVEEIAQMLSISLRSAYNLCNSTTEFRVLRVGGSIRIPKDSFDAWLRAA